jgi:hypothetical protein
MFAMNHETCPELYNCHRVKMTPLIRALMRCTAAEAMESICTTCQQEHSQGQQNDDYMAPSGEKIKVVVGDEAEELAEASPVSS